MDRVNKVINLPFKDHLTIGALIRLVLIQYADYHDDNYDVPYTDVDYKVFTDAARHVVNGDSPYHRHTYRYSPILAYLMIPNIVLMKNFGKILFSGFDILIAIAVKFLVEHQLWSKRNKQKGSKISVYCSLFWLYNPMSIGISTRGNADSVPCLFIILSLYFLQTNVVKSLWKYALSGALLGTATHLRLYPLAFCFPMYLSLGEYKITRKSSFREGLVNLLPNSKQVTLAFTCTSTLTLLTYTMYQIYGYEFLFETYIYHLFRKDTRHNFSLMFYYSYITMGTLNFDIVKTVLQLLECVILFALSLTFGCDPDTLPFALFCQAVVLVTFNTVMTSQYFIWFLSLLPLVVHNLKVKPLTALILTIIWISAQGAWLFYAYLLEFKGKDVFVFIWFKSLIFFCANIFILAQLIKGFCPGYGFGQLNQVSKTKTK